MNRIRILLYGNLRVNKGLRCWFKLSGHSNIKKMLKFANFIEILYFARPDEGRRNEMFFSHIYLQELLLKKI